MEGDAGASRLNPTDADDSLRSSEVKAEDSAESEVGTDSSTADKTEDAPSSDAAESEDATSQASTAPAVERGPSRLGRGWAAGIAAALVLIAAAVGGGGYLALRYHLESKVIARNDAAALKAAVECVSATQAPDTSALVGSEQKIIDCGTDAFRSQALLYTSMLVQAYQAANVHVEVADVRAAVERHNNDGTVDVLVAMRVKVASEQTQSETGYRLRVKMSPAEGGYKIAKLDQVTK
jgi:Mce-associated membrane protein